MSGIDYNAIIAAAAAAIRRRRGRRRVAFLCYVVSLLPGEEFNGTPAERRGQKWVLLPIAFAMSRRERLPSIQAIAAMSRTSVRTARRDLRLLAASGWLTTERSGE